MYKYWWDQSNYNITNCNIEHLNFCTVITNTRWLPSTIINNVILSTKEMKYSRRWIYCIMQMVNTIQFQELISTVYEYYYNSIYGEMVIYMSKYHIILIIFKWCVSKTYLIVLILNLKYMHDQSDQIDKIFRALYWESFLLLQYMNRLKYIQDNEILGNILGWTQLLSIY